MKVAILAVRAGGHISHIAYIEVVPAGRYVRLSKETQTWAVACIGQWSAPRRQTGALSRQSQVAGRGFTEICLVSLLAGVLPLRQTVTTRFHRTVDLGHAKPGVHRSRWPRVASQSGNGDGDGS